jgi:hypothetical protein
MVRRNKENKLERSEERKKDERKRRKEARKVKTTRGTNVKKEEVKSQLLSVP